MSGVVAGCGGGDSEAEATGKITDKVLKVGVIAPLSGDRQPAGDEIINGLKLYLDFNNGLLGGHAIELVTAEEGDSEQTATAAADQLINSGVSAIVGVSNSMLVSAVSGKIESAKIPMLGTGGGPASVSSAVFTWSTSYVDDEPGEALGTYMKTTVKSGKIAMIAPAASGRDAVDGFRSAFGNSAPQISDGPIWMPDTYNPSAGELIEAIEAIEQLNADVLFCHAFGPAAVTLVKQMRASGLDQPIYAPGLFTEGTNLAQMDTLAEGIFTAHNYAADLANTFNQRFADNYRRRFSAIPTAASVAAYDAGQVLDRAIGITKAEGPSAQDINRAIGQVGTIDSPRGSWQFNQPRTPQQKWYLREVRRDGTQLANVLISELSTLG
ncbi:MULTISPECIES: ABC transporter substrate-binding protein [Catenuloplanes]|uniref:Branched-chain amino acid transport system substrate-binding protein n=1 Tax=Catenuloplanes niger TaxID=587534 RepID=A0AAE3ZP28_9ACTN|nr:ABC transporter substrate-binding protein [Catenuloplanes niger]MDR7323493.1 branched-chain amino acid transport system substrate-binding protein [Catenuloplanes niger]